MSRETKPGIADPTIAQVLDEFLAAQKERLASRTFKHYEDVVELLRHCLDGYGHQGLSPHEAERYEKLQEAGGDGFREFCEILGPEHILPGYGEFLGYFMVRKVAAGKDFLRAAGTVTRKLARWLGEKGYAEPDETEMASDRAAAAARDLPEAEEVLRLLGDHTDRRPSIDEDDVLEAYFTVTRVEGSRVWLEEFGGEEAGPISLPANLARRLRVGWTLAGALGRRGGKWHLVGAWNLYPD